MQWETLTEEVKGLIEPRLQLHYAVQTVASLGDSLLEKKPDWSHSSLQYLPEQYAFYSESYTTSSDKIKITLKLPNLELQVQNAEDKALASTSLYNRTLQEAIVWLKNELNKQGINADKLEIPRHPDDFPNHPLSHSARFSSSSIEGEEEKGFQEIASYYKNTMGALQRLFLQHEGASPIRTWPHHFDMSTLITIREATEASGEDGSSVGIGFSPGDGKNPTPYWYVSPWPYFAKEKIRPLSAGVWNTEGWFGALLKAEDILADPNTQESKLHSFLEEASQICLATLS